LSAILARRLRATDVAGQLDDGRVGALLPNTSAEAAWRVADEVRKAFDKSEGSLRCEVYAHPFPPSLTRNSRDQERPGVDPAGRTTHPLNQVLLQPLPWWKRALDIVGAATGLVLLSPLLAVAAIGIKWTSPGPILFQQVRVGLGGKPFTIYKFRTMCLNAEQQKQSLQSQNEQDGPAFKIKNDPRVTTFGRYLRVTCIDELPQLFNILTGDMTLVGPRPLPIDESDRCQDWEQRRLDVTPGLTCIWQAAGRRERISFADWMRMDLRYIKGRSVRKDLTLLWRTFVNVISHRGSH
jgi:lipopolysaccharide/colanic/teichoic acid biosynthesis glycosyltransferase